MSKRAGNGDRCQNRLARAVEHHDLKARHSRTIILNDKDAVAYRINRDGLGAEGHRHISGDGLCQRGDSDELDVGGGVAATGGEVAEDRLKRKRVRSNQRPLRHLNAINVERALIVILDDDFIGVKNRGIQIEQEAWITR